MCDSCDEQKCIFLDNRLFAQHGYISSCCLLLLLLVVVVVHTLFFVVAISLHLFVFFYI